mgnify:CR=1 FL=1
MWQQACGNSPVVTGMWHPEAFSHPDRVGQRLLEGLHVCATASSGLILSREQREEHVRDRRHAGREGDGVLAALEACPAAAVSALGPRWAAEYCKGVKEMSV